jgi:hypothetical protein
VLLLQHSQVRVSNQAQPGGGDCRELATAVPLRGAHEPASPTTQRQRPALKGQLQKPLQRASCPSGPSW